MDEKLTKNELEDFIISLTLKQKELLLMSVRFPILSGASEKSLLKAQEYGMNRDELGGRIGSLMKRKTEKGSLLKVVNRDERGRKHYGFNDRIASKEDAVEILERLLIK